MPPTIRTATPDDAYTIVEFNQRLATESEGLTLNADILAAGVAAVLADANKGRYFVAIEDGQIVGQLMITTEWSDWRNGWIWWIQSVYVREPYRRQGIFRALYQYVHALAVADPLVVGLRLYVEHENHRAQETYLRLGMGRTGYLVLERCPL